MADNIKLSITTADGSGFEKQVNYVNLPTTFGSVGILHGHAPMLCAVDNGLVRYSLEDGSKGSVIIGSGVATVDSAEVTLLVQALKVNE